MKTKSGIIWRVAVVVAMVLAMVPVLVASPVLAAHTSSAEVAFTAGASTVANQASSLDVTVTNGADSDGDITEVKIDFTGTGFTAIGAGTEPGEWTGVVDGVVVTYTGGTIAPDASVTFVPEVTNPTVAAVVDPNPTVKTTDDAVLTAATLTDTSTPGSVSYEAVTAGSAGNDITITYTATTATCDVDVTGTDITVDLAYTDPNITSTAAEVVTAINGDGGASVLVTATEAATGLMEVMETTNLDGGIDAPVVDYPVVATGELTVTSDILVTSSVTECTPGEELVTIEVTVENAGTAYAIGQVLIDIPPIGSGLSTWHVTDYYGAGMIPGDWSVAVGEDELGKIDTLTYTGDTIADGAEETFTFTATAPSKYPGGYAFGVTTWEEAPDLNKVVSTFTINVLPVTAELEAVPALAEGTLDKSTITVTLARDTYVAGILPADFTLTGAPAGVTVASVAGGGTTEATLTLAFDGTDFDKDANLGVTVLHAALVKSTVDVVSKNTLTITAVLTDATATLAVVGDPLTEENLDGSVVTVTVAGDTYVDPIPANSFTLTTTPILEVTIAAIDGVVRTSDTVATLTLTFDETDFDEDAELEVTVAADALTYCTENVVSTTLPITATVEPVTVTLAVVGDPLTEENLDESVITATVAEDTYVAVITAGDFTLTAPEGTTVASVVRTSDTVATLTLAFDGTPFDVPAKLEVTVAAEALVINTEDVLSNWLAIGPLPVSSFEMSETVAVVDEVVEFTGTSELIDTWEWDFDSDGTVDSTLQNPTHAYAEKGVYTVTLTVTNILGDDTTEAEIIVVPAIAGPEGPQGPAGADGADGLPGADGAVGPAGADGAVGPAGADGAVGPAGADGAVGADGAAGAKGDSGNTGAKGDTGNTGAKGDTGDTGAAGADGAVGPAGATGATGATGAAGAQGEPGGEASKALPIVALVFAIVALLGVGFTILRKG